MHGFSFDLHKRYEIPNLLLTNPNRDEIGILTPTVFKNLIFTPRFNALSEISFSIYEKYSFDDSGELQINPYYHLVTKNRLIFIKNIGWFVISGYEESIENDVSTKNISCFSYEYTLNSRGINLLNGTYKLYNEIDPKDNTTLLGKILEAIPNWNIGNVDSKLWNKYRTFDVPNATVYGFLMGEVENAYECIFDFDTDNQLINVYSPSTIVKDTDIVLSFSNLIKHIKISQNDNDIITTLAVYGDGDLDIRNVNPVGDAFIRNFDYYKTTEWMSQDLINAINAWEAKIKNLQGSYSDTLSLLKSKYNELLGLQIQLTDLNGQISALEQIRTARTPDHLSVLDNGLTISSQIDNKQHEIILKQKEVDLKQDEVNELNNELLRFNEDLSFKSNFTEDQYEELSSYIYVGTFQNTNYVKTSNMSPSDIQDMSLQLYEHGKNILSKMSQPQYLFSLESANFLFIENFKPFIEQIELGALLNIEMKYGDWVYPILLEMVIDYEDPTNFSMKFGNRFRLDDAEWTLGDLYDDQSRVSSSVASTGNFVSSIRTTGIIDEVSNYMSSALDLSRQSIINNGDDEVIQGEYGIRLRKKLTEKDLHYDPTETKYSPNQVWLYSGGMGFTDDNWQSCKAFLGSVKNPIGEGETFGIIGQTLVGEIMATNQLIITNENNHFRVDANGATLINASFTLITANNTGKITLDPSDGIKIQTNDGSGWKDKFYVDNSGNLVIDGKIIATSGSIGGWRIANNGLFNDNNGDYIRSDGTGKLSLLTWNTGSATFDGNIYARNLRYENGDIIINTSGGYGAFSIGDFKVTEPKLATDAVTTQKVSNGAITADKIASSYKDSVIQSIASVQTKANATESSVVSLTQILNNNGITSSTNITQKSSILESSISSVTQILSKNGITSSTNITQRSSALESSISAATQILSRNGLTSSTNITQKSSTLESSISSITQMLSKNGITSSTNITQRSSDIESKISLSANYGSGTIGSNVRALIQLCANADQSGILIRADKIQISGTTTFSSLLKSGTTTIDGAKIAAGSISASAINTNYLSSSFQNASNLILKGTLQVGSGGRIEMLSGSSLLHGGTNLTLLGRTCSFRQLTINGSTYYFLTS